MLLQLSLLPSHDWREKLEHFRKAHQNASSRGFDWRSAPATDGGISAVSSAVGPAQLHALPSSTSAQLRSAASALQSVGARSPTNLGQRDSLGPGASVLSSMGSSLPVSASLGAAGGASRLPSHLPPAISVSQQDDLGSTGPGSSGYTCATGNAQGAHSPGARAGATPLPPRPYSPERGCLRRRRPRLGAVRPLAARCTAAAPPPWGAAARLSDATGQSEWWDAFLAGSVGGLGTGAGGGAATDKATRQPPPLSPGRADSGGGDGVTGPAASLPPGYTGMYAYAGGGKYMLSNVSETYDARMKAAQMRAALRFDEHKMSQPDQHAYEAFRQTASAFRSWRSAAATSKAEANHFRAAVNRWLLAVGFWESRLLTKCVVHWKDLRGLTDKKGDELAARHRVRELRRNLRALMEAHHAKFRENKQIVHALAFFGAGLSRRAFDAWRRSHLQAKSWFLMGEQAHLERAFKQLRKGATGVARVAHVWIRAAGVHQDKVVRACLNRLLSHAQSMIHAQAAMAYWRNAAIHACLDHWAFLTKDAHRTLRLLRGALSHHASVLLQAIMKEWYIAVRHEVIAQNQWRQGSLAVAMSRWTDAYRINVTLSACAFGFAASSETALARAYLRDWHLMTTRKQAKAAKAAAAVVHAWMSMVNYVMSMWRRACRRTEGRAAIARAGLANGRARRYSRAGTAGSPTRSRVRTICTSPPPSPRRAMQGCAS